MVAHRWFGASLAISIATTAFISCKSGVSTSSDGTGGATSGASGSGGSGGADTSAATGTTTTTGPITCSSSYTNITKGTCDLLQQDCTPGRTCQPVGDGKGGITTGCEISAGLKTAGESCYAPTECDAQLLCIGQPVGKCVALCCPNNNEPCNGGLCNTQVNFGGGKFLMVCNYGKRCTPLTADACPQGQDCHVEDIAQGLAICGEPSPQPVSELEPCTYLNDCRDMQQCFRASGSDSYGVCLYYCDTTGSSTPAGLGGCPADETCEAKYMGQPINLGIANLGLCIPAAGLPDAGADSGSEDAGGSDAATDSGSVDAGGSDAGADSGSGDAGKDGGGGDAGMSDAGKDGSAPKDAGTD